MANLHQGPGPFHEEALEADGGDAGGRRCRDVSDAHLRSRQLRIGVSIRIVDQSVERLVYPLPEDQGGNSSANRDSRE
ncbi:unnamed protein product [Nesidiocoris tenuis]|uniref:Uncharacterized protein n=1 Tax=Nesidiocoris tenuis TaxID=355587 RepID=A0A6H5HLI5_9HEMI|nr:unnamed protein product [Nesidiocoris tenuis]